MALGGRACTYGPRWVTYVRKVGGEALGLVGERRQVARLVARRRHQGALQLARRRARARARALQRRAAVRRRRRLLLLTSTTLHYIYIKTFTNSKNRKHFFLMGPNGGQ